MQIYEVRISHGARADMAELRKFLKSMMTVEGAIRYANNMREEIKTLAFYADLYGKTTSMTLRQIHPEARRMVSHNRKWVYVYHIEASTRSVTFGSKSSNFNVQTSIFNRRSSTEQMPSTKLVHLNERRR